MNDDLVWSAWSNRLNRVVGDNLSVDMYETDNEVVVRADLPDVLPENVEVEERDGWLSIRTKNVYENERDQSGWHVQERRYGVWQRTLKLPTAVHADKADASLKNGVLCVKLPKVDAGKPLINRIKIKWPKLRLPQLGKKEPNVKVVHG